MEALKLNPGTYEGTYKLIGGELSLDFINTISWEGKSRSHDWLDSRENALIWASEAGLQVPPELKQNERENIGDDLESLKSIRAELKAVLKPMAFNEKPSKESIENLNVLMQNSFRLRYLHPESMDWQWREVLSLTDLVAPVIWNASYVLTDLDHRRLKYCGSCEWLFYDRTRSGTRKWCDMADCGGRDKALRYYHRKKGMEK